MFDPQQLLPFLWLPPLPACASSLSILFEPCSYRYCGRRPKRSYSWTEGCSRSRGSRGLMEVRKPKRLTFSQWAQPGRIVCFVGIFGRKSIGIRYGTVYDGLESYPIGM